MKIAGCLIVAIFLMQSLLIAENPGEFNDFLRNIDAQSRQFKGSQQHDQFRTSRSNRDYQVGDQHVFWSWALNVMPPEWLQTPATCRAVGEHCYLFVADEEWGVHMDQSDVDEIMPFLEENTMNSDLYGAIEMDTTHFGSMPDELDNDPKVIVFYMELGSFAGSTFDGYFSSYNQVTEAEAQTMNPPGHSNECEMIYMTCHPLQPDDPIRISVLSHELQHLIHWGADINESTWVNEGCSELAMVLFGLPDPITSFPNNPDNSLITWDQQWADYIKTMLFFTYLYEHFDIDGLIYDLVADPANSISGIQNQLIEHGFMIPFNAIFANWTIANYIDDPDVGAGQYNYQLLDLPQFTHSAYISSFPANGNGSVEPWAAEYLKLNTNIDESMVYTVSTTSNHEFAYAAIYYETESVISHIETYPAGVEFSQQDIGSYEKIVLVISNNTDAQLTYSYNIETEEVSAQQDVIDDQELLITAYPNPCFNQSDNISFASEDDEIGDHIVIFNMKGQKVKELDASKKKSIKWNKRNKHNKPVANGVYYYRLKGKNSKQMKKLLIIK